MGLPGPAEAITRGDPNGQGDYREGDPRFAHGLPDRDGCDIQILS
jgi:hypothetical protein